MAGFGQPFAFVAFKSCNVINFMAGLSPDLLSPEQDVFMFDHLTDFSRLLARQVSRRGLVDHMRKLTQSSGREKTAFGGPNQAIGVVPLLAQPPRLRCAPRLAERPDLAPSNDQT